MALMLAVAAAAWSAIPHGTYAQSSAGPPQGDEFNNPSFTAPFTAFCAPFATGTCPDPQGDTTWSLDANNSGALRIWTQFGSLLGATDNARNLILQPVDPLADWQITTKLTFPATGAASNPAPLGQTAGLIVYQDSDNFIFVGRTYTTSTPDLKFVQEINGVDAINSVTESAPGTVGNTVYLRLAKTGSTYQGYYSYDNQTWTQFTTTAAAATPTNTPVTTPTETATPTATSTSTSHGATDTPVPTETPGATSTPAPTGTPSPATYTAGYSTPKVGLFAYGGTDTRVTANMLAADFDWFRVGNSTVPAPTATATATAAATTTATAAPSATATNTAVPSTATPTATAAATQTPVIITKTVIKTKTVVRRGLHFDYVSLWYHPVHPCTSNHVQMQASMRTRMGIWAHVFFPNGAHVDWYAQTTNKGFWAANFPVPCNIGSSLGNHGVVTFQLWHGKTTVRDFVIFPVS